jgi:NitT/TauT family transport system substrate-binding protein
LTSRRDCPGRRAHVDADRRAVLAAALSLPALVRAQPGPPIDVVLATPGPASAVSMVPELSVKIGADRAEGVALRLKFVSGGGVAIREIYSGNAQFGVFGLPAAMNENLAEVRLVALAAVEDRTPLSVMVRSDLRAAVRRVEDLRGRVLGVHSNSLTTTTTGQQFLILALRQAGVPPDAVRFVAAGQSWETQSATLRGKLADAIVSEEPFGLRLEQEGLAFPLLRIGHPGEADTLPGAGFLRGTLIAQRNLVEVQPQLAEQMVRVVRRTLSWLHGRSSQSVVDALGLSGAEALAFLSMLDSYPRLFSSDGRFSQSQLEQTLVFFREGAGHSPESMRFQLAPTVIDRWAGRKP